MNILVIAPHRDDEIIGCGGTIAKYIHNGHQVFICFVTLAKESMFPSSIIQEGIDEAKKCHKYLDITKTFNLDFPAVLLEQIEKHKINKALSAVINEVKPDITYIPHYGDMHLDHQIVADCAMVALRPNASHKVKEIYAYETLSETEWNYTNESIAFVPNVWNDISNFLDIKLKAMENYQSQLNVFPHPRSIEAIKALSVYRGSTVLVTAAECFRLIRKIDL